MKHALRRRVRQSDRASRDALRVPLGVLAAILLCLSLPSAASAQSYEPNDSYITGFGPIEAGTTYSAGTETDNDEDYYYFYVPQRAQMFFNLTATKTVSRSVVCGSVYRQTYSDYDYIGDTYLQVREGETETAAVTLDPGKYYFVIEASCASAGEAYTFRIDPAGATSTYEPFAAACAAANAPVVATSQELALARASVAKARRKLARARALARPLRVRRARIRISKVRLKRARRAVRGAKRDFSTATANQRAACSVPM